MASYRELWEQNITLQRGDGTSIPVSLASIDDQLQYCVRICINYGSQLGASIILIAMLILLSSREKRSSAVFWLNGFALLFNIARLVCQIVYFTTPFVKIYPLLTQDFTGVPVFSYATSILGVIFVFFVVVCMEVSLVLQVQIVCSTYRRRYRRLLLAASVLIALAPIAFRLALSVVAAKHIVDLVPLGWYSKLESTTNIIITVSICFFCAIFVVKLGFAIKLRKKLGVREFGPMKVIFVMGCQTMIVPALFSILQYFVNVPELASNVVTLVVIFLPLSSIWAGSSLEHEARNRASNNTDSHRQLLNLSASNTTATTVRSKHMSSMSADATNTTCVAAMRGAATQHDPELSKYGISVEHDISVQSYHKDQPSEEV